MNGLQAVHCEVSSVWVTREPAAVILDVILGVFVLLVFGLPLTIHECAILLHAWNYSIHSGAKLGSLQRAHALMPECVWARLCICDDFFCLLGSCVSPLALPLPLEDIGNTLFACLMALVADSALGSWLIVRVIFRHVQPCA